MSDAKETTRKRWPREARISLFFRDVSLGATHDGLREIGLLVVYRLSLSGDF